MSLARLQAVYINTPLLGNVDLSKGRSFFILDEADHIAHWASPMTYDYCEEIAVILSDHHVLCHNAQED